jgi:hypothetical protein
VVKKRNNGKKYLPAFKVTGTISHLGSLKKATVPFWRFKMPAQSVYGAGGRIASVDSKTIERQQPAPALQDPAQTSHASIETDSTPL